MRHAMAGYEQRVAPRKQTLFAGADGKALEIGCGLAPNRRYLGKVEWIGVDPNPYMEPTVRAAAEQLPFPDATFDLAIATLVLCSVGDPAAAVAEVRRVLKPGGRFLFLEHVAAPAGARLCRWQRWARPICRVCADGCDPMRDTAAIIRAAGFARVTLEEFSLGFPHIAGEARTTVTR